MNELEKNNMAIWYEIVAVAVVAAALVVAFVAQRRARADPALERIRSAEKAVWESVRYIDEHGVEHPPKKGGN